MVIALVLVGAWAAVVEGGVPDPSDRYSSDPDRFAPRAAEAGGGNAAAPFDERLVASANARWAATKEIFQRAEMAINVIPVQLRKAFETSAEYKAAMADLAAAQAGIDAAEKPVLDALAQRDEYRSAKTEYDRVAKILRAGRLHPTDQEALSQEKLGYGQRMHRIEFEALANDAAVQKARAQLQTASARVSTLRDTFEQTVRLNPEFLAARKAYGDARVEYAAASAYLDGLVAARCDALNAFYTQQYYSSIGNVSSPYNYGPYYNGR